MEWIIMTLMTCFPGGISDEGELRRRGIKWYTDTFISERINGRSHFSRILHNTNPHLALAQYEYTIWNK